MEKVEKVIAGMLACNGVGEDCDNCPYNGLVERCSDVLWAEATEVLRNLKTKYTTALEMAATATELAAQAKKVDGDLISRADLMKYPIRLDHYDKENGNEHFVFGIESVLEYAEYLPTIEAEPVVHAHWEDEYGGKYANPRYRCSACKEKALYKMEQDELLSWHEVQALTDRCHHCGAHMDETLELRTCYCPMCDKHFRVRSNASSGNCPDCGHHVVLRCEEVADGLHCTE